MASASPPIRRETASPDKRAFVNGARSFAKRVTALPGFPYLWIGCAAFAAFMTVAGGFRTSELAIDQRALFWALLLGWNGLKWQTWFALTVRRPADWTRASLIGGLLLNLLLPFEIAVVLAVIGVGTPPGLGDTWLRAVTLSLVVAGAIAAFKRWHRINRTDAPSPGVQSDLSPLLARAGVHAEQLLSIKAEDHYCRVHRADGTHALIHYRFGDALREMAGFDGVQVHRGAWVAAAGVRSASRSGRRWQLHLVDGTALPISATHLPEVRARGWLMRRASPSSICS